MSYVFRLHDDGVNTITGWGNSTKYGAQTISKIIDPDGAKASREITSIPSPFARIDLMKTAFKSVVSSGNLEGDTIYHKMVSDAFDVGQIFFEIDKYSDFIEIVEWDKERDLRQLLNSNVVGHKQLAESYRVFLEQDARVLNFDRLKKLYFLNYTKGVREINIIGATSPATLFFTSANNLQAVGEKIHFGKDKPFDEKYAPLYSRDIEYQKFWYMMKRYIPEFTNLFTEVSDYLEKSFELLSDSDRDAIQNMRREDFLALNEVQIGPGNSVQILDTEDFILRKRTQDLSKISDESDFAISSTIDNNGLKPLVLPIEKFTKPYKYVNDTWVADNCAPLLDGRSLDNRVLPFEGTRYPYLTIGDFLESKIVEIPSKINKTSFFDGHYHGNNEHVGYLLPIKKEFFKYFTPKDLMGEVENGKKMFEIKQELQGNAVSVTLRIPVRKNFIEYQKTYFRGNVLEGFQERDGRIVNLEFDLAVLPNFSFKEESSANYRVVFNADFERFNDFKLGLYKGGECLPEDSIKTALRNETVSGAKKTGVFSFKRNFDFITLSNERNDVNFVVVPKFRETAVPTKEFEFAIDLGTTNTHVQYRIDNGVSFPLNIREENTLISYLSNPTDEVRDIFDKDLLPQTIEDKVFPIRTALSEAQSTDWNATVWPLGLYNIPFLFQKKTENGYNKTYTNLKWGIDEVGKARLKAFIDNLMFILRNKVLRDNGVLERTKIKWFYPISMSQVQKALMSELWKESYEEYFLGDTGNVSSMNESISPYYYFKEDLLNFSTFVNIDIGGETSDIVIADPNGVRKISSVRFASNSIFGNVVVRRAGLIQSGILKNFKDKYKDLLSSNNFGELGNVLNTFVESGDSADLASFLFSLSSNKAIVDKELSRIFDFNRLLAEDSNFKIIFIIFYAAHIYHLASLMKASDIEKPNNIGFSGNGSKVLKCITPDIQTLEKFTNKIFNEIYGDSDSNIQLIFNKNPKEATCLGGLMSNKENENVRDLRVMLDASTMGQISSGFKLADLKSDEYLKSVEDQVINFLEFIWDLNSSFSFEDNFGADRRTVDLFRDESRENIKNYISNKLRQNTEGMNEDEILEETLFFYPLSAMFYELSNKIYQNLNQQS